MSSVKVNFFLAGFQKCGSTWLYKCFSEHPQILAPRKDTIHYFTINHHRGTAWYHQFYADHTQQPVLIDATPSYGRDLSSVNRVHQYNPDAKILFCLRNPIDRAFSHYWHKKRKGTIQYEFDDTLFYRGVGNHDLYKDFVSPGFYYELIKPWIDTFGTQQVKLVFFDDLNKNASAFLADIFSFLEIDSAFVPSVANKKLNAAASSKGFSIKKTVSGFLSDMRSPFRKDEYKAGMSAQMRSELAKIYAADIHLLEELTKRDLSHWK